MAKDVIERWFRLIWDDSGGTIRDLSGDLVPGSVTGGGKTLDEEEMTGVSEEMKNFLAGQANSEIAAQFYLNDTLITGSWQVLLRTVNVVGTLTLQFGTGAAPSNPDPEWEGEYLLLAAPLGLNGNKIVMNCRWVPGTSASPLWGTVT